MAFASLSIGVREESRLAERVGLVAARLHVLDEARARR